MYAEWSNKFNSFKNDMQKYNIKIDKYDLHTFLSMLSFYNGYHVKKINKLSLDYTYDCDSKYGVIINSEFQKIDNIGNIINMQEFTSDDINYYIILYEVYDKFEMIFNNDGILFNVDKTIFNIYDTNKKIYVAMVIKEHKYFTYTGDDECAYRYEKGISELKLDKLIRSILKQYNIDHSYGVSKNEISIFENKDSIEGTYITCKSTLSIKITTNYDKYKKLYVKDYNNYITYTKYTK